MICVIHWAFYLANLFYWAFVKLLCWTTRLVGPVPKHVAFIMDGNRRYEKSNHLEKNEGHEEGYKKLVEVVKWCLELGVEYISVYAFSIDNFKRSPGEVSFLMHQAERKYVDMMAENGLAASYGVEVRVVGDLSLTPETVQDAAARVMAASSALPRTKAVLNICFSYTASHEMARAVAECHACVRSGAVSRQDVTLRTFQETLLTKGSPGVDMLVRTSGETRLSDFMLWQCRVAQLVWVPELWPDFSFSSFIRCVLRYQLVARDLRAVRHAVECAEQAAEAEQRRGCRSSSAAHGENTCGECQEVGACEDPDGSVACRTSARTLRSTINAALDECNAAT